MCGIVGLFLKDKALEPQLGHMLSEMLVTMTDRGPDSAGIAIYGEDQSGQSKITIQSEGGSVDYALLQQELRQALECDVKVTPNSTHAVIKIETARAGQLRNVLQSEHSDIRVMSQGDKIEIYKEVGLPEDVSKRFQVSQMAGSHGIGHTRMATESAVTTDGAHPYSTGPDQCLVHNGSLSNHNALRRKLTREGIKIESENDTEVGAAYLTWKMA